MNLFFYQPLICHISNILVFSDPDLNCLAYKHFCRRLINLFINEHTVMNTRLLLSIAVYNTNSVWLIYSIALPMNSQTTKGISSSPLSFFRFTFISIWSLSLSSVSSVALKWLTKMTKITRQQTKTLFYRKHNPANGVELAKLRKTEKLRI